MYILFFNVVQMLVYQLYFPTATVLTVVL